MTTLVFVCSLLGYWYSLAWLLRVGHFEAPLILFCFIILTLYFAALAGVLATAAEVIVWLGAALVVSIVALRWRQLKLMLVPEALFYLVFFALLAAFTFKWASDFMFLSWDEFSHWALVTKHVAANNALYDATSEIIYKFYPPGIALLHYYFVHFLGYSEAMVLFAHLSFFCACIFSIVGSATRRPLVGLTALLLCVVFTYALGYKAYEVTVDHILGGLLGAVLATHVTSPIDRSSLLRTIPILAVLPLIKHVGLAFALVGLAAGIGSIAVGIVSKVGKGDFVSQSIISVAALGAIQITYHSWKAYYTPLVNVDRYDAALRLRNAIDFFVDPSSEKHKEVWREFARRFFHQPFLTSNTALWEYPLVPAHMVLLITAITALFVWLSPTGTRCRNAVVFCIVTAGFCGFLGLVLLSYGYFFSDYESVRLASFERYYGSYLLAWVFTLVGLGAHIAAETRRRTLQLLLFAGSLFFLFGTPPLLQAAIRYPQNQRLPDYAWRSEKRVVVAELARKLLSVARPGQRVYFIHQHSVGYEFFIFKFEVLPIATNGDCWSLGMPYTAEDVYTCNKELDDALKGYRFLVVGNGDLAFWSRYGDKFEPGSRGATTGVFEVNHVGDVVSLRRVD